MHPVVIVGSGPAGSSCAFGLASAGVRCLLIDRAVFPREKVCGGALSPRGADLLANIGMVSREELDSLTLASHRKISFWDCGRRLARHDSSGEPVRIVRRSSFDNFLLEKAVSAGADVLTGIRVLSSDNEARSVSVEGGKTFPWSSLVCADGANGPLRRAFGRRGRGRGIGLEVHLPAEMLPELPHELQIRFGLLPYGYGWVFPDREEVCFGAGVTGSRASSRDVREALNLLLGTLGIDPSLHRLKGALIPSMAFHPTMGEGEVYLAGDAAGLVDQVSGEGISHAIESGTLVAEAIVRGGDRASMLIRARKGCLGTVRQSAFYRHLLFHPALREEAMFRLGRDAKFAACYWGLISGEMTYSGMLAELLTGRS